MSGLAARASDPQAQLQEALDLGFSYLGHRDRTIAEVRRHLERKRVEPAAIDGALAELGRLGYLDDARYAQRFAEDRRRLDAFALEMAADLGHRAVAVAEIAEAEVEGLLKLSLRVSCPLMDQPAHAASSRAGTGGASSLGGATSGSIGVTRSRLTPSAS